MVWLQVTHPCSSLHYLGFNIRAMSRSSAEGWAYIGRPYCLKRRLANSTRRLTSTVRLAFLHSVAIRCPNFACLSVHLVGCLSNKCIGNVSSSDTWPPPGLPELSVQMNRSLQRYLTLSSQGCSSTWKNNASVACLLHSPDWLGSATVSWGSSRPFSGLPRFPLAFTLVHIISFTFALALNHPTATRTAMK